MRRMETRGSWARLLGCLGQFDFRERPPLVRENSVKDGKIPAVPHGRCNRIPWTYSVTTASLSGDEKTKKGSEVHRRPISCAINCYLFNMTKTVAICSHPWLQPEPRRVVK